MSQDAPSQTPVRRRRWGRVLVGVLSAGVLILTGLAGAGAVAYTKLDDNLTSTDVGGLLGDRPNKPQDGASNEPMNILVMGSDTREGQGSKYGDAAIISGARSDTTLLVHVNADHTKSTVVSIPRDTMVDLPECTDASGKQVGGYPGRFNEAFYIGGPACTIKTFEDLTGVYVDDFVVVDFKGFKGVVNALGGVEVCLPEAIDDPQAHVKLPAGQQTLNGEQALGYVRARYTLGDGSDISRIDRQQDFISSVVRQTVSSAVLLNPVKLYKVLDAGTKSLTTNPELGSLDALATRAMSVSNIKPGDVTLVTAPINYNTDGSVALAEPQASLLWQSIKDDTAYPPPPTTGRDGQVLTIAPKKIAVEVVNATGDPTKTDQLVNEFSMQGYSVVGATTAATPVTTSKVAYDATNAEAARTVAYAVGTDRLAPKAGLGTTIRVVVGQDFDGVKPVLTRTQVKKSDPAAIPAETKTAETSGVVCTTASPSASGSATPSAAVEPSAATVNQ